MLCKGEYPNNITVNILNTDNPLINNTSLIPQVNDQLMLVTGSTSVSDLNTFTVNVSLSNNGGTFDNVSSFGFSKQIIFYHLLTFFLIYYRLSWTSY